MNQNPPNQSDEKTQPWIEVEVTIETTTTEKGRYQIDRREFDEWAGDVKPADLASKVKEFLRAGDEWEVCSEVHHASRETPEIVDCEVRSVTLPPGTHRP